MFHLKVIDFLLAHDVLILSATFAFVWIFGIVNWCKNVYRRQNRKFERCRASVLRSPKFTGVFVANLPEEYRRQWRAFVNSGAERPSLVYEFVPRKNKTLLIPLFVLCAAVSLLYFALFLWDISLREYAVYQVAMWLAFAVVMITNALVFRRKEKHARQVFGKFVAQLNATDLSGSAKNEKTLTWQLEKLAKSNRSDTVLEKAAELLHENGLEGNRTADEQRTINRALNSLLQAYARNTANE